MRAGVAEALKKLKAKNWYCPALDDEIDDRWGRARYNGDFYSEMNYDFYYDENPMKPYDYGDRDKGENFELDESVSISMSTTASVYCCGIPELGDFQFSSQVQAKDIATVLDVVKRQEGTGYLRATTTSRPKDRKLNEGLKLAGFVKHLALPSKHGGGRYKVYAWEWFDPKKKVKQS